MSGGKGIANSIMIEGVHYMPVPRCATCEHWDRYELTDTGVCYMTATHNSPAYVGEDGLETDESFGCVEWKAKE